MCTISFNLNYNTSKDAPKCLMVETGGILDLMLKPKPQREGYIFTGWFKTPECNDQDEWIFGAKLKSFNPPEYTDSMPVTEDMTLYAGWQQPIHITDEIGLSSIRNNLKGWYILDNDIVMSDNSFEPIGVYGPSYEYADAEWWKTAFRGKIDGMGHTIKNLHLTSGPSNFIALISAAGNCTITNLNMDGTVIDADVVSGYVAPLIAVVRQGQGAKVEVSNCKITNTILNVKLTSDKFIYSSVSGLVAGMWDGSIVNCHIDSSINVKVTGNAKEPIYIGGLLGEGYSLTEDSIANVKINTETERGGCTYIGLLQASGTSINNCNAKGNISVCGKHTAEDAIVYVGSIVGSIRYNDVKDTKADLNLKVKDLSALQLGGVAAEFNKQFGVIGPMVGVTHSEISGCETKINLDKQNIGKIISGEVCGDGIPEPLQGWGGMLSYNIQGNNCKINQ